MVASVLAYLLTSDSLLVENLALRFLQDVEQPEVGVPCACVRACVWWWWGGGIRFRAMTFPARSSRMCPPTCQLSCAMPY